MSSISPQVLIDDLRPTTNGQAAVRFVHFSPNAPAVDVSVVGGPTLFSNISFKTATPYIQVAAGTYNLQVSVHNTTTIALRIPNVSLSANTIYSAFAEGLVGGAGIQALQAVLAVDQ